MSPSALTVRQLTKALRQKLRDERARTGFTAAMLLDADGGKPDGLTASIVNRWVGGMMRDAPASYVEYVLARYSAVASNAGAAVLKRGRRHARPAEERLEVTPEMARHLRAEFVRTGLDQTSIIGVDAPSGLTVRIVKGWLYREAATTRVDYWLYVMARLEGAT